MNVLWQLITVIQMLTVPTQMDLSTVHVTKDTVATEHYVKVSFNNMFNQKNHVKVHTIFIHEIFYFSFVISSLSLCL